MLTRRLFTSLLIFNFLLFFSAEILAQNCSQTSVGLVPLIDLGTGEYQGFSGGLYPGGANQPPTAHLEAGLQMARQIVPLDTAGNVDLQQGHYVLLSIGMSNATQEFSEFITLAENDSNRHPQLIIVDGAQGGWSAEKIIQPDAAFWSKIDNERLPAKGVTPQQVQIVWLKEANARPTQSFPQYAQKLQDELRQIVQILKSRYPNLKLVYLSSRTYGGYATNDLNPEPYAYQSGFAVKWLIQAQIEGDSTLNYDPARGEVKAPWLAWGPYLWTDGVGPDGVPGGVPGRSDGLEWVCSNVDADGDGFLDGDVQKDGTHPSKNGRLKVAKLLLQFFNSDTTAKIWYRKPEAQTGLSDGNSHSIPAQFELLQNYPNPFNPGTTIRFRLRKSALVQLQIFTALGQPVRTLISNRLSAGTHHILWNGRDERGRLLPAGIYFSVLRVNEITRQQKLILIR